MSQDSTEKAIMKTGISGDDAIGIAQVISNFDKSLNAYNSMRLKGINISPVIHINAKDEAYVKEWRISDAQGKLIQTI